MNKNEERILVIGGSSPLLEGVSDLLQLAGYQVDQSSSRAETEYAIHVRPPNLAIVDLSSPVSDVYRLSEEIDAMTHGSGVPVLFISFSGDDHIRDLQRKSRANNANGHLQFYAHTLLSMDGLLDKVQACLS
ncbi:MAG: response regulator [Chloroflexota bacterium]|jgi:DNA-binding response OmpR family regulator